MLKTIRTATIIAGVSAFAIPAIAQDAIPNVPGSETVIEENNAATRDAVAAQPDVMTDAPVANATNETIIPGNESQIEMNEADERNAVAAGTPAETTGDMASGDQPLVPGSGATFSPGQNATGEAAALQDEANTQAVQ